MEGLGQVPLLSSDQIISGAALNKWEQELRLGPVECTNQRNKYVFKLEREIKAV